MASIQTQKTLLKSLQNAFSSIYVIKLSHFDAHASLNKKHISSENHFGHVNYLLL